jgi:GNAT superfamily N-acetyltransferase
LEIKTIAQWDEQLWDLVRPIYQEGFAKKGAKPEKIIRNMFRQQLCFLHIGFLKGQVASIALTGKLKETRVLLIDYLAVSEVYRNHGYGRKMVACIQDWALSSGNYDSLLIEVESEETTENLARINFWKKCGFTQTDYLHQYIWVPETYLAMYKKLRPGANLSEDGRVLFQYISQFHKASYQRK